MLTFNDVQPGERRDVYIFGDGVNLNSESSYVDIPEITPGKYHICNDSARISFYVVVWRNGASVVLGFSTTSTTPITIEEGDKFRIFFACNNPIDGVQEYTIHPVLVKDGGELTTYEPYTGGQPSPSPDYPQPITSAGKYNEEAQKYEYQVKLTGKNLWNAEEAAETSKWVASTSQTGYSDFAIDVVPGQQITFSFPEKLPLGIIMYVGIVSVEDGSITKWLYHSTSESLIVQQATITAITDKIWVRCNASSIEGFVQDNPYFQIEYGSKRTAFQPYKEQTVTLTADRPLTKWDKLEKRNGQWGWVYKSMEITLDESEEWRVYAAYKGYYCAYSLPFSSNRREGYAENIIVDTDMSKTSTFSCWLGVRNNSVYVINAPTYNLEFEDGGIENWRDWLSENPLTILTYLDEETFVPLSESEQEQMNALHTYYPTTVLSNDTECEMSIKYIADTKTYIDSKIAAIQAAVVNTI